MQQLIGLDMLLDPWSTMFNPLLIDNFLTQEEIHVLLNFIKKTDMWESGGNDEYWASRVIHISNKDSDMKERKILSDIRSRISNAIKSYYDIPEIYSDGIHLVRWFDGMELHPHCDDMSNDENNHIAFGYRKYGSIIYLNDDFQGGETFYPKNNFYVKPKVGNLSVHPGDQDHLHGVTKVEGGTRYTIASFWTDDKAHANEW